MLKKVVIGCLIVAVIGIGVPLYPIIRLGMTDETVTQSLFGNSYYVKTTSAEGEYAVFTAYMESRGWVEDFEKQMGAGHHYEKDGEVKIISNRAIKTVFIDGRLNGDYLSRWWNFIDKR